MLQSNVYIQEIIPGLFPTNDMDTYKNWWWNVKKVREMAETRRTIIKTKLVREFNLICSQQGAKAISTFYGWTTQSVFVKVMVTMMMIDINSTQRCSIQWHQSCLIVLLKYSNCKIKTSKHHVTKFIACPHQLENQNDLMNKWRNWNL